jgi:hypothetical protein
VEQEAEKGNFCAPKCYPTLMNCTGAIFEKAFLRDEHLGTKMLWLVQ